MAELGRTVTEKTKTAQTVTQQQYYQGPPNFLWLKAMTMKVGSTTYPITEIVDQEEWDLLNMTTQYSDTPTYCFIRPNWGVGGVELGIFPIPSSTATATFTVTSANATVGATYTNNSQTFTVTSTIAGGTTLKTTYTGDSAASGTLTKATGTGDATITFSAVSYSGIINLVYEASDKDLSQSAYTTGTVTMVNGSEAVVGDGTTWIAAMVGRYFKITSASGDGQWYRVATRTGNTAITLENYYDGASGATLNYTINEAFALPEEMQILPCFYALFFYNKSKGNTTEATNNFALFEDGLRKGKRRYGTKSRSNVIKKNPWRMGTESYPNYFPESISS